MKNRSVYLENLKVKQFIENWQIENPFESFKNLDESNSKFKKDFNEFLNSGDFSESTKNLFLIN